MGLWDIRVFSSPRGGSFKTLTGLMTAGEGFLPGEPVLVAAAGGVSTCVKDGTEILIAEANGGLAINGPGAAATAELIAADGWGRLYDDPDTGAAYAAGGLIHYVPWDSETLFVTENVVAAAGGGAGAAYTGADRGDRFQITYVSGTTPDLGWGLERTAGVIGTDLVAEIVDILDATGRAVALAGAGTQAVFRTIV